ncbi:MAG: hypothetical protein KDE19_13770, partial [Caldilineaceae bacterium]|nr:hypothetical protein [Caldilineaceae bacterium]
MPHECLSIGLLGGFRLIGHCEPETAIAAGRISLRLQLLLAYLLLHRDAPQPREHLAFLFWPDTSEAQALTNLRNLLHKLRRLLPAPDLYLQIDSR